MQEAATHVQNGRIITATQTVLPNVQDTIEGERLYKSSQRNVNFIFPNGRTAHFKNSTYFTSNAYEIAVLDSEVASGHPVISYDPNHKYITEEEKNPMLALRKKHIEEYLAEQAAFLDAAKNVSTSDQGKFKPASTTDIAAITAGGVSTATLANLVASRAAAKE